MEEKTPISFRLNSILDESTSIKITKDITNQLSLETLRFQFKVNVELDLHNDKVSVTPFVRYKCKETEILSSSATFIYDIPGLKNNTDYDKTSGEINQQADIIPTLVSASFSSMRGIIFYATKNNILNSYPLPLVGLDSLLHKLGISVIE